MATALSYSAGLMTETPLYQSIPDRLRHLAEDDPTKDAFVFYQEDMERIALSRHDLYVRSVSLAKVLVDRGLQKGQTVGFCMNNSIEMLLANFAVITAGGIPFYLATNLRDGSDVIEMLQKMEARMLFIDANEGDDNWKIIQSLTLASESTELSKRKDPKVPTLGKIICNGNVPESGLIARLSTLMKETNEGVVMPRILPEDTVCYLCTSGSTGVPKIVAKTHYALLNWSLKSNKAIGIRPESIFFNERPMSWAVGWTRTYPASGTTRVFVDTKLSLDGHHITHLCDIIQRERCDVIGVPRYLSVDLMRNPKLADRFQHVDVMICAGERIQKHLAAALLGSFCKTLVSYYGNTETGGSLVFAGHHAREFEDGLVGKPLEGVDVKVVDEQGNVVEMGDPGELYVRSPFRFTEYKNDMELFAEALDHSNWFRTGDVAHFRRDGNLVIDGRKKEWIVIQTIKYFPWEVENALKNLAGVKHAIAVGVPDERLTNTIGVCIVPEPGVTLTTGDVKRFCDETFVEEGTASRISLKPAHHVILETLPLTYSGKIDRIRVAEIAKHRIGQQVA